MPLTFEPETAPEGVCGQSRFLYNAIDRPCTEVAVDGTNGSNQAEGRASKRLAQPQVSTSSSGKFVYNWYFAERKRHLLEMSGPDNDGQGAVEQLQSVFVWQVSKMSSRVVSNQVGG